MDLFITTAVINDEMMEAVRSSGLNRRNRGCPIMRKPMEHYVSGELT